MLIYQLFYNLINNSLKFSREGIPPVVELTSTSTKDGRFVELILKDNGIGFGHDDGTRIFKTFSRLNPKDQYEGTGLGLALCQKIVERHGGSFP